MSAQAPAAPRGELAARLQARGTATTAASFTAAQKEDLGAAPPARLAQPESADQLRDLVVEAGAAESALLVFGSGSALGLGHPLARADLAISTRALARIVEHSAADFVVTVEAGCRLADLQRELAAHRQWLAIEPPDPERATIGGLIASAATSLVASGHGTLRNHLLGVRVLHADGRFAKAGGRVVKNVAGYDLMKMHHGALGTLGIVAAATLRLRPLPAADLVAWTACEGPHAIELAVACADTLAQAGFLPAGAHLVGPIAAGRIAGDLVVRFQGARSAVMDQLAALSSRLEPAGAGAWRREVLETAERFPRPRPLLAIEQACSRGDEAGIVHLALHFRPSRLREALAALETFGAGGAGQVALELARGTGFLKVATSGIAPGDPIVAALERLKRDFEDAGGAIELHAGPATARAVVPPFVETRGRTRIVASLLRELDPRGLLHRGRLGPLP